MFNDNKPPEGTQHRYFLYSVGAHEDGREFFDLLAEKDIAIDYRGTGPHCQNLLRWAVARVRESRIEFGLFCAEFSPVDEDDLPGRNFAQQYFTWGVGPTVDGESTQTDFSLGA